MKHSIFLLFMIICFRLLYTNNINSVLSPTAGVLSRGEARIHQKIYRADSMSIGAEVGLFENFMFGLSYGAEHIVGDQKPVWYNRVDPKIKYRIINETLEIPAIAIGIDTQGHGLYNKQTKRYDIKSKGLYAVASKNFTFLGLLGVDFGANFTFERADSDDKRYFDMFAGMYKTLGNSVIIYAEFIGALNDYDRNNDEVDRGNRGNPYVNTAVQIQVSDNLSMKLQMFDMFRNRHESKLFDRAILLDYRWFF
jgi:hypothetical protein